MTVQEMIQKLSPDRKMEAIEFIEFLLERETHRPTREMTFDWAGGLKHLAGQYTSVDLQHKANEWRIEDETSS